VGVVLEGQWIRKSTKKGFVGGKRGYKHTEVEARGGKEGGGSEARWLLGSFAKEKTVKLKKKKSSKCEKKGILSKT